MNTGIAGWQELGFQSRVEDMVIWRCTASGPCTASMVWRIGPQENQIGLCPSRLQYTRSSFSSWLCFPKSSSNQRIAASGETSRRNKAEALARKNGFGDATALTLVNSLRTRAGVPAFTSMTEGQLLAERGRELFIEGLRRTDLIRFGAFGNAWWEKPAHTQTYKNLMAIPLEQIQATASTANKLTQNPGY